MRATITISTNVDGGLNMLTHYDGGFRADDSAHQATLLLSAKMGELAEAQGPAREPTAEECAQIQGLAEPWANTIPALWGKVEDAMLAVDAANGSAPDITPLLTDDEFICVSRDKMLAAAAYDKALRVGFDSVDVPHDTHGGMDRVSDPRIRDATEADHPTPQTLQSQASRPGTDSAS